MPMDLRMERIITENADLLDEGTLPGCFLDLCAHVAAYKAVVKQWERGDYSRHVSVINFPKEALRGYVTSRFLLLKQRQRKLLNRLGEDRALPESRHLDHETIPTDRLTSLPPAT